MMPLTTPYRLLLPLLLSALLAAAGDGPRGLQAERDATRIEFRQSRLIDHDFWLRQLADPTTRATPDVRLVESVETVRRIGRDLGHPLVWGLLETPLADPAVRDAAAARDALEKIPGSFRLLGGRRVALHACGGRLARALEATEDLFLIEVWPEHRRLLRAGREALRRAFEPRLQSCLQEVITGLGMKDPGVTIPVYLVARSPWPGGFTQRGPDGSGICFIGLDRFTTPSQLWEGILHEALHALDVATGDQPTLLRKVRERLREAGAPARLSREVVHTIMFAQAAVTVGDQLTSDHRPYGEVSGTYERVGVAGRLVPPLWAAYHAGELTEQEVIDRLVEATVEAAKTKRRSPEDAP